MMNAFDIRVCIKFLTCMGAFPQLDSDEDGATMGVLEPNKVYRWYITSNQHVSAPAGIPKRVLAA